jgi:ABC-type enterobactin transport system permease subunit
MKNWQRRALRTALQTAIGYLSVALPTVDWSQDKAGLRAVLIGIGVTAVSSGIAAFMNYKEELI